MDLRLSAEQQDLRDSAARIMGRLGPRSVRDLDDAERIAKLDAAIDAAGWRELRAPGEAVTIIDTRKGETPDRVLHVPAPGSPVLQPGETVTLEIDWPRRYRLMRLHTALHLLSCVITAPVTGGNIAPDKARLDFDVDLSQLNAERIERETNALIAAGAATETVWITDAELDAQPELVKTMSVQPPRGAGRVRLLRIPGIDLQPCGGTHVADIAEIEGIRVLKIRSEGKRNKRVEIALSGSG